MKKYYTTYEAMIFLGLTNTCSVRSALSRGRLKGTRKGRDWLIAESDLVAYKNSDRKPGPKSK